MEYVLQYNWFHIIINAKPKSHHPKARENLFTDLFFKLIFYKLICDQTNVLVIYVACVYANMNMHSELELKGHKHSRGFYLCEPSCSRLLQEANSCVQIF